jgi:hypothetical protein
VVTWARPAIAWNQESKDAMSLTQWATSYTAFKSSYQLRDRRSSRWLPGQVVLPEFVQERLGYAGVPMTMNRCSHVTPDIQRLAPDMLDAAFRNVGWP